MGSSLLFCYDTPIFRRCQEVFWDLKGFSEAVSEKEMAAKVWTLGRLFLFYCPYVTCSENQNQDDKRVLFHRQAPFQGQDLTAYRSGVALHGYITMLRKNCQDM